jgi:uncharacterized small protein (DUF1192 family)
VHFDGTSILSLHSIYSGVSKTIIKDHEERIDLLKERIEKLRAELKDARADVRNSNTALCAAMGSIQTLMHYNGCISAEDYAHCMNYTERPFVVCVLLN